MEFDGFSDLVAPLRKEIKHLQEYNALTTEGWDKHQRVAGKIEGLQQAIDIIEETVKKMLKGR